MTRRDGLRLAGAGRPNAAGGPTVRGEPGSGRGGGSGGCGATTRAAAGPSGARRAGAGGQQRASVRAGGRCGSGRVVRGGGPGPAGVCSRAGVRSGLAVLRAAGVRGWRVLHGRDGFGPGIVGRQAERRAHGVGELPAARRSDPPGPWPAPGRRPGPRRPGRSGRREVSGGGGCESCAYISAAASRGPERRRAGQHLERRRRPARTGRPARRPGWPSIRSGDDVVQGAHEMPGAGQPGRGRHGPLAQPEIRQVHVIRPARAGCPAACSPA